MVGSFLGGFPVPPFPTGLDLAMGALCGRLSLFRTTSRHERFLGRPFRDGRPLEMEPVDQEQGGRANVHALQCGNEVEDVAAGIAAKAVVGVLREADSELSRALGAVRGFLPVSRQILALFDRIPIIGHKTIGGRPACPTYPLT